MSTKLLYYNVFICKNGEKTDFPLQHFLDFLMTNKDAESRYKDLKNGSYTMNMMRQPVEEEVNTNRSVWVGKYREKKPYQGQRKSDIVNPITGDVFEPSTCLFIPDQHCLIMEYNHIGCKDKGLQEYFNSFLFNSNGLKEDEDVWTLETFPVKDKKGISLIKSSNQIKSISIEFLTNSSTLSELVKKDAENKLIIEKLVGNTLETAKEVEANVTTLTLKKSRYKNDMKVNILTALLASLNLQSEGIISVKVSFKNSYTGKTEEINLKHDGLLKDEILEGDDSNGFEYMARNISEFYYNKGSKKVHGEYKKHKVVSIDRDMSVLI